MMENEKILKNIVSQLEALKKQVERMNDNNYNIHKLDIEILQNVIRELYEQVLELNDTAENKPEAQKEVEIPVISVPEVEKEVELPKAEAAEEKEVFEETPEISKPEKEAVAKEEVLKETNEIPEPEKPQVVEFEIEAEKEIVERPKQQEVVSEKIQQVAEIEEYVKEEKRAVRSTIDLFSTTAEPTISDKFLHEKEPSIADRMMQKRISDLRQAIGINEKFLFINELFNGDMGKYNKALDELNEMKTKEGVVTYFIELKIHNQWKEDNEAFIKFKELLDRKIE